MSAYNESQSSTSAIHHVGVNFNLNHMISSPTTSRSGLESDMNIMRRGQVFMANSTWPETNVARYAESWNMSVRAHPEDKTIFEMDHSATVSKDIGIFLNDTKLFDYCIKVRKPSPVYTNQAIFVSDSLSPTEDKNEVSYETFRVHKIILAARWTYFNTLFCSGNWKESDKNFSESKYDFFESEWMKIFLEYLYTGKMKMELRTIIGVLRIASFYSMPIIMESWKSIMDSDFFTALDLCHLYKEVRDNDFDGISNYLSELIPKRTTNETIWRILKEIWRENDPRDDSDEMMIGAHNLDESRSMAPVRSSKIELWAKHVISFNQEIMSEIISTSDAKSVIEEDEKDLPHKLINKIQKTLPEIYNKEDTFEELIKLPKSALIMIFKSDKSWAPELMFFNILLKISNLYNPITKHYPLSLNRFNKSSVDGTWNDDNHITINELEEEKEEEEEIPYNRNKQIQDLNNKDPLNYSESRSEGEEDNEEEKSCKLDATISERTNSWIQIDPKMSIKELIPHVRLSLINRKSLITEIFYLFSTFLY